MSSTNSLHTTIIVPTYREVDNLEKLVKTIDENLSPASLPYNILVMDDVSNDGSKELCEQLSKNFPVTLIERHHCERGLSESVIDGLSRATGDFLLVMDADLSHAPESLPAMINTLSQPDYDFVIGSRYVTGGEIEQGWGWRRLLNSKIATWLARPLISLSDPMSGFFGFRKEHLPPIESMNPIGYKIGLEILVKGNFTKIKEIPISFKDRTQGESKLGTNEQLKYLRHLRRLYQYKFGTLTELGHFCLVGLSGMAIDILCYLLLTWLSVDHKLARAIAFWPAVTWNWFFNRVITFNDRQKTNFLTQWFSFALSSSVGFLVNWGSYVLLTEYIAWFAEYKIVALFVGILLGTGFNFTFSNFFVFSKLRNEPGSNK